MNYDIAIIGAGPAGYTAALEAARYNKKVVIFERNEIGGVCLNAGCIPLKSFLHISKIYRQARTHGFELSEPDIMHIREAAEKCKEKLKNGLAYSLKNAGTEIVRADVLSVEKNEKYIIRTSEGEFVSEDMIVATGSQTVLPPIEGLSDALTRGKAITSKEFFEMQSIPDEVVIIGAGVIGIEIAGFYTDLGKKVVLIDSRERILPEIDEDIYLFYIDQLEKQGMQFVLGAEVCEIDAEDNVTVVYQKDGEVDELCGDLLIVAAGRSPVRQFQGIDGVYICGDANGELMLAHTAMQEAVAAVHRIVRDNNEESVDYDKIPSVIYSSPELAWVGAGESDDAEASKISMDYSSRYVIESDGIGGCIKTIKDNGKTVGCQIVGDGASELIAFMLPDSPKDVICPHPSICEILNEIM